MSDKLYYQTKDLYLAALLQTKFNNLCKMEGGKNGEFIFFFPEPKECEFLSRQYFEGKGEVSPRDFVKNIKDLKGRLFSLKENK